MSRSERVLQFIVHQGGQGLEIGPLDKPLVSRKAADVKYVDILDREGLCAHYASDPTVDKARIPQIDYSLTTEEGVRSLAQTVKSDRLFDWVVASHVIEHVPDMLGWLKDLADITRDDAVVVLMIPDRRYTFDIHRQQTTLGQVLEAYDLKMSHPSVRAVYDHFAAAAKVEPTAAWLGELPTDDAHHHGLEQLRDQIALARAGRYVDCHVWTFTPATFVDQMIELGRLSECSFVPEEVFETPRNDMEFLAVLRRLPREAGEPEIRSAWDKAESIYARLGGRYRNSAWSELKPSPEGVMCEDGALLEYRRREITRLRDMEATLRSELLAVKTSQRWRVGGLVITPAAKIKRALTSFTGRHL